MLISARSVASCRRWYGSKVSTPGPPRLPTRRRTRRRETPPRPRPGARWQTDLQPDSRQGFGETLRVVVVVLEVHPEQLVAIAVHFRFHRQHGQRPIRTLFVQERLHDAPRSVHDLLLHCSAVTPRAAQWRDYHTRDERDHHLERKPRLPNVAPPKGARRPVPWIGGWTSPQIRAR